MGKVTNETSEEKKVEINSESINAGLLGFVGAFSDVSRLEKTVGFVRVCLFPIDNNQWQMNVIYSKNDDVKYVFDYFHEAFFHFVRHSGKKSYRIPSKASLGDLYMTMLAAESRLRFEWALHDLARYNEPVVVIGRLCSLFTCCVVAQVHERHGSHLEEKELDQHLCTAIKGFSLVDSLGNVVDVRDEPELTYAVTAMQLITKFTLEDWQDWMSIFDTVPDQEIPDLIHLGFVPLIMGFPDVEKLVAEIDFDESLDKLGQTKA